MEKITWLDIIIETAQRLNGEVKLNSEEFDKILNEVIEELDFNHQQKDYSRTVRLEVNENCSDSVSYKDHGRRPTAKDLFKKIDTNQFVLRERTEDDMISSTLKIFVHMAKSESMNTQAKLWKYVTKNRITKTKEIDWQTGLSKFVEKSTMPISVHKRFRTVLVYTIKKNNPQKSPLSFDNLKEALSEIEEHGFYTIENLMKMEKAQKKILDKHISQNAKKENDSESETIITKDFPKQETLRNSNETVSDIEYSNSINHQVITDKDRQDIESAHQIVAEKKTHSNITSYPRNPKWGKIVIENNNYQCLLGDNHKTFTSNATGHNFVEAHHLIPMNEYKNFGERFNRNIDCPANIVPLCPNCHRQIHHATDTEKAEIIENLFNKCGKKEDLASIGINITLDELLSTYDIHK